MPVCGICMKFRSKKASAVLVHGRTCTDNRWLQILEAKRAGLFDKAARIFRKMFGLAEPMSEEAKAKLKAYNEEHKEEIAQRAKAKRQLRRRTMDQISAASSKLRRRS